MELDTPRGRALATVKLAVFLDMIGVGIFVPMLSYYWKELGVRTELMGFVSSAYNISQVCERKRESAHESTEAREG